MIALPNVVERRQERLTLAREMLRMKLQGSPLIGWLQGQLSTIDIEQRTEHREEVYKPRQGAAIAISQILEFINNSKQEVADLEG